MRAKTEFRSVSLARFNTGLLVLLLPFRNFADAPKPMRISYFWRIRADCAFGLSGMGQNERSLAASMKQFARANPSMTRTGDGDRVAHDPP